MLKVANLLEIPSGLMKLYKQKIRKNIEPDMETFYSGNDRTYKKKFFKYIVPKLYHNHISSNFKSCIFCINLQKSHCHSYCFTCSRDMYPECSPLLPETAVFISNTANKMPWIFMATCANFQRLEKHDYLRHLVKEKLDIVINNLEILEGLFFGISNGNKPCHVCASVDMNIFDRCSKNNNQFAQDKSPCPNIYQSIQNAYEIKSKVKRTP